MARKLTAAILCTLFCVFSTTAAESAEDAASSTDETAKTYLLRYKFKAGESIRTKVVHQAAVKTTISGTSQTARTTSISVKRWDVKEIDSKGQIAFVHSVDYVDMKNDVTGRDTVRFDSRAGQEPPPGFEDVARRVAVPLSIITMDSRGKIIRREEKAPGNTNTSQLTMPLPEEAVPVGHTWTFPYEIEIPLQNGRMKKVKMRQLFELSEVEDGLATVEVATQVLTPNTDPEVQAQLVQRQSEGAIRFNIGKGRIVSQQFDVDRRVTGHPNPKSTMRYRTRFTETLLDSEPQTATRPPTSSRE